MDDLTALRLQLEWGADEALLDLPADRFAQVVTPLPADITERRPVDMGRAPVPLSAGPALAARAAAGASDLAALHAAMDAFDACPLRATASSTVAPSGNAAAGLVLIGDAPGPDEDRSGQAFSGPGGERLDRVLASAGLDRTGLLLVPMVAWRPPGGRPVSEAELALCLPFLFRLLALAQPHRIVLLGAGPYRALGGESGGFRKARGQWRETVIGGTEIKVPALTMLAPDMWLSSAANKQATWADLIQLKVLLRTD